MRYQDELNLKAAAAAQMANLYTAALPILVAFAHPPPLQTALTITILALIAIECAREKRLRRKAKIIQHITHPHTGQTDQEEK